MAMKFGGINDMPRGYSNTDIGRREYLLWYAMFRRCYDTKEHSRNKGKSYVETTVCDRWFSFKTFVEDIHKLAGYDEWVTSNNMVLDKDICSQGEQKIYSPDTCRFITREENGREMMKRCKPSPRNRSGNNKQYALINGDDYKLFDTELAACTFLGVRSGTVSLARKRNGKCKGWNVVRISDRNL